MALSKDDIKEIACAVAVANQGLVDGIISASNQQIIDIIRELRKPTDLEQKQLDAERAAIEQKQKERLSNAAEIKRGIKIKRELQRNCSHEHPNGDSHCVYIMERIGPGYILCQKNQCIIRPGEEPENYNGNHIYNTALFNRLFQGLRTHGADIIG